MKTTEHGIEESKDVENIHHMRLMALLQELVREKGYKGAARVLEIDPQTVTDSGQDRAAHAAGAGTRWSGRCRRASARRRSGSASATRSSKDGSRAWPARSRASRARSRPWARRCAGVCAGIEGAVAALGRDAPQGTGAGHAGAGPQPEGSNAAEAGSARTGRKPPSKPSMRREYPDAGDAGACPRRRGDIRGGVAADRGVAGAEGRAPQRGQGPLSGWRPRSVSWRWSWRCSKSTG